jgi:DNA-binding MarR family transcriptional regulator
MSRRAPKSSRPSRLQLLAEFRHQLRLFLHFSETASQSFGLHPQQHQLLLQIAGAPDNVNPTIGYAAERLGLRHNTAVELSNRCEEAGLVVRKHVATGSDRRCVLLEMSAQGKQMLDALSIDHARELNDRAPQLIRTLTKLKISRSESRRLARKSVKQRTIKRVRKQTIRRSK